MKVALIFSNYGPYHLARIESFFNHSQKEGWETVGIELARSEAAYPWKSELQNLPFPIYSAVLDQPLEETSLPKLLNRLYQLLERVNPDVLAISGYFHPAMLMTLAWSRWHRKPAILFSETTGEDARRSPWREQFKSWLLGNYQAALVGGQPHKRYFVELGMPEAAIFLGYDVVEIKTFEPKKIRCLPRPLENPYFLAINRFVWKKNLPFLVDAYAAYQRVKGSSAWHLVLCGDGQLKPQIEQQIVEAGMQDYVHLPGFLQQDELLPYFAHAACFVHASIREQWGLVINEAMAAGLPILVSNRCGSFEDLVLEGVNGFGFNPEHPQELTELMIKISSDQADVKAMGQASFEHIQKFSPDYFAQGLTQAIEYALAHYLS